MTTKLLHKSKIFWKKYLGCASRSSIKIQYMLSFLIEVALQYLNLTVIVSRAALFPSRYRHYFIGNYFVGDSWFPWGSHYFLVNNYRRSCCSLVYYDWKSYFFWRINHRYTGDKPFSNWGGLIDNRISMIMIIS